MVMGAFDSSSLKENEREKEKSRLAKKEKEKLPNDSGKRAK